MTKQDIEKHKALVAKIEKAVNESNLEDKWKYIINSMFDTNHILMESRFIREGGSLK